MSRVLAADRPPRHPEVLAVRSLLVGWLALLGLLGDGCSAQPAGLGTAQPLGEAGTFLVSPRWSTDGRQLLASGRGGVGLVSLPLEPGSGRPLRLDSPRPPGDPGPGAGGEVGAQVIWERGERRVLFDAWAGAVLRQDQAATPARLLTDAGAWGVTVSSGGAVAFCSGPLTDARLQYAPPDGPAVDLGPGAQPAWFPDGSYLLYVVAEWDEGPVREVPRTAELWAYEPGSGRRWQLTHTPEAAEMQPAVSPDGRQVAWSDWRAGRIVRAPWTPPELSR